MKPKRAYFILPPAYRPLAFALSTAVVALFVWDMTQAPSDITVPRAGWDGGRVAVKSSAEAPPSINVSGRLSGKFSAPPTSGRHVDAPGKPLGTLEEETPEHAENKGGALRARSEEERSAINERLYKGLEVEKKRIGIAKIIDKGAAQARPPDFKERELLAATRGSSASAPAAPRLDRGRMSIAPLSTAKGGGAVYGTLVQVGALKSPEALQAAWASAGLSGEPPAVRFPRQMALFLDGPPGCGIVSVLKRKKSILVLYKGAGFNDASARLRVVPFSPQPVIGELAQ